MHQQYSLQNFLQDYASKNKNLSVKVRFIQNHFSYDELKDLLKSRIINDEEIFDEIFINKIFRKLEIVNYILSEKINFSNKQLDWISKTRIIQNDKSLANKFENLYKQKIIVKRFSINKLQNYCRSNKVSISSQSINRTMKIGVDVNNITSTMKDWLERYIDEWKAVKEAIYKDLFTIFKNTPEEILLRAASLSYSETHNKTEKILIQKEPLFILKGNSFYIYKLRYILKGKQKEEYVASDGIINILLKKEINLDDDNIAQNYNDEYILNNFSAQSFYNDPISPKYFSVNPSKKYSSDFYRGFKISQLCENLSAQNLRENMGPKISQTICSFLDKYYKALSEIQKIFLQNKKEYEKAKVEIKKNFNDLDFKEYPTTNPHNDRKSIIEYNSFITTYNQFINENIWQKSSDHDIEDKFPKLKIIKGVPSFPVVEKQELNERDYKKVLEDIKLDYENIKKKFISLDETKIDIEKLTKFLRRKSSRAGKDITEYFNDIRKKNIYKELEFKQLDILQTDAVKIVNELLILLEDKINKSRHNYEGIREAREIADLFAQYISIASELVFDKKSVDYFNFRIRFNTNTALLKAAPFEDKKIQKDEISFSGFSVDKKDQKTISKRFAIVYKIINEKLHFFIIFNLKEDIHLKFLEQGEYYGIAYLNKTNCIIKPISFDVKESTCILPLQFGKRIGRRYLYNQYDKNSTFNGLEYLKDFYNNFQNVRVIREVKSGKEKYYCSISLERRFNLQNKKDYDYQNILGIDMGEKIPAMLACIDKNNNILWIKPLHKEMNKKLWEIQTAKDSSQRNLGHVSEGLRNKISNLTKKLLEDITIESIETAVKNKAIIVTEDLARGFGRYAQKGTYVWMKQYTKLNDVLFDKSREIGLTKLGKPAKGLYTNYGILAKVPASYTSKTSIQTGFIFGSFKQFQLIDEVIMNKNEILIKEDKITHAKFTLNIINKSLFCEWKGLSSTIFFDEGNKKLIEYFLKRYGEEKYNNLIDYVFNRTSDNTKKRRGLILSFVYTLLNPRKTQEEYYDIFTGRSVNCDAQGAINIARSFLFGKSKYYKKGMKSDERLLAWLNWYQDNLKEIPEFLFENENS